MAVFAHWFYLDNGNLVSKELTFCLIYETMIRMQQFESAAAMAGALPGILSKEALARMADEVRERRGKQKKRGEQKPALLGFGQILKRKNGEKKQRDSAAALAKGSLELEPDVSTLKKSLPVLPQERSKGRGRFLPPVDPRLYEEGKRVAHSIDRHVENRQKMLKAEAERQEEKRKKERREKLLLLREHAKEKRYSAEKVYCGAPVVVPKEAMSDSLVYVTSLPTEEEVWSPEGRGHYLSHPSFDLLVSRYVSRETTEHPSERNAAWYRNAMQTEMSDMGKALAVSGKAALYGSAAFGVGGAFSAPLLEGVGGMAALYGVWFAGAALLFYPFRWAVSRMMRYGALKNSRIERRVVV